MTACSEKLEQALQDTASCYAKGVLSGIMTILYNPGSIQTVIEIVGIENISSSGLFKSKGFGLEEQFVKKVLRRTAVSQDSLRNLINMKQ